MKSVSLWSICGFEAVWVGLCLVGPEFLRCACLSKREGWGLPEVRREMARTIDTRVWWMLIRMLTLANAGKSGLRGIDSVVPICARILRFGKDGKTDDNDDDGERELEYIGDDAVFCNADGLTPRFSRLCTSSGQYDDHNDVLRAPGVEPFPDEELIDGEDDGRHPCGGWIDSHILTSSFKPPSRSTSITYIRRTEDVSRYILLYPAMGLLPLFTTMASFQNDNHCLVTRTHPGRTNSVRCSLNFHSQAILNPKEGEWEDRKILEIGDVNARAKVVEEAYLASIRRGGNWDVVRTLWWVWHSLEDDDRNGGRMGRVSWQECRDIVREEDDGDFPEDGGWFEAGVGGVSLR